MRVASRAADPTLLALSPEAFEARVHKALLPRFRRVVVDIKVQKRARRKDSLGVRHEFDLWYRYRVGVVEHHVAVEVRRRSRPVSLEEVRAFFGKIDHMPQRPAALIVSLVGFQSGARQYATKNGIGMYVLRTDLRGRAVLHENPITRWSGRINTVRFAASLAVVLADATAELHVFDGEERSWRAPRRNGVSAPSPSRPPALSSETRGHVQTDRADRTSNA